MTYRQYVGAVAAARRRGRSLAEKFRPAIEALISRRA